MVWHIERPAGCWVEGIARVITSPFVSDGCNRMYRVLSGYDRSVLIKWYRMMCYSYQNIPGKINFHFARDGIDASMHRSDYVLLHKSFIAMIKFHLLYKSWMYGQMLRGEIPNVLFGIPIAQQASVAVRKILQRWQHVHIITVIRVGETKVEMEVK